MSANLPDVLLLRECAEQLLCCQGHAKPPVEEGFPADALRFRQAGRDLGLESCELGLYVDRRHYVFVTKTMPLWSSYHGW